MIWQILHRVLPLTWYWSRSLRFDWRRRAWLYAFRRVFVARYGGRFDD